VAYRDACLGACGLALLVSVGSAGAVGTAAAKSANIFVGRYYEDAAAVARAQGNHVVVSWEKARLFDFGSVLGAVLVERNRVALRVACAEMPDFLGRIASDQGLQDTRRILQRGGARFSVTDTPWDRSRWGTCVAQSPAAGTLVRPGDTVSTAIGAPVVVPSTMRASPEEVAQSLGRARLGPVYRDAAVRERDMVGLVLRTDPPSGDSVAPGDTVTVLVGRLARSLPWPLIGFGSALLAGAGTAGWLAWRRRVPTARVPVAAQVAYTRSASPPVTPVAAEKPNPAPAEPASVEPKAAVASDAPAKPEPAVVRAETEVVPTIIDEGMAEVEEAVQLYNRGLEPDGGVRSFLGRFRPRRVRAYISGDDVFMDESQVGILLLVQGRAGWWVVPDPDLDRFQVTELVPCFIIESQADLVDGPAFVKRLTSVGRCRPAERGWVLTKKGEVIAHAA
jgi:hypothetical protein